ncbi:MAG: hypothetical protein GKS00_28525 [Alphaproteobacteria bacterium]|nr:hypothetical protein [Alphaproteobacteria bacterium]
MKFALPLPPSPEAKQDSVCKYNVWLADAGWRLRTQIADQARAGFDGSVPAPVVVVIAVPEAAAPELSAPVGPVIGLLSRHGVIAAELRGLTVYRHDGDDVEITLEPAALSGAAS